MKKISLLWMLVLLIPLTSAQTTILNDDFEDGNINGWNITGNINASHTTIDPIAGSGSMEINTSGSDSNLGFAFYNFSNRSLTTGTVNVSILFRMADMTQADSTTHFVLSNDSCSNCEDNSAGFVLTNGGIVNQLAVTTNTSTGQSWLVDTVYSLNVFIDLDSQTMNTTMNGTQFGTDNTVVSMDQFKYVKIGDLASGDSINATIDNVVVITSTLNFTLTARNNRTGASITDFNATLSNSTDSLFFNTTTGTLDTNLSQGVFNITVRSTNFFNNITLNHNVSNDLLADLIPFTIINATDSEGATINNFTVNYTNNANSSDTGNVTVTNGQASIPLFDGTYTVTIFNANQGGVNFAKNTTTLTASSYLESHTFSLFSTNSFNIQFFDEETNTLASGNLITVQFISDLEASTYNTSNGTLFVNALMPAEIEIRYDSTVYDERSYYHFLTNQSFNNLTLYVINESTSSLIILDVVDQSGSEVNDVTVQLLRGFVSGNTQQFNIVEMDKTDFAGEAVLHAELNNPLYQVRVVRNVSDNEILFFSNSFEITGTTLQVTANLLSDPLGSFTSWRDIVFTKPTYDNTTAIWTATFNDVPGLINPGGEICLEIDRTVGVDFVFHNKTCSSASSGTLQVFYNNSRHGSVAKLIVDTNTENSIWLLSSAQHFIGARHALATTLGTTGPFMAASIVYVMSAILIFNPTTFVFGVIIGFLASFTIGLIQASWSVTMVTLIILGGLIALKTRT